MSYKIFERDKYLLPFESDIDLRMNNYRNKLSELLGEGETLSSFANGHKYFGFHKESQMNFFRAPQNARVA